MLALLLARCDQPVDPQVILDLVWGDQALPLDVSVVHTTVARLRRAIGSDQIETTDRGYRLRAGTTDESAFSDHVARAERLRQGDPDRAIQLYREALGLWRADRAYADVTDHLVAAEVAKLGEWRSAASQALAELLMERGEAEDLYEVVRLTRDFVEREPLHERAHELYMLGLWRAGRQAEALATYERFRLMLRDELGIDPSASTAQLHSQMLAQDPTLEPARRSPTRRLRPAPPAPTTPLVGREVELATTLKMLSERRLVVVTGLGGVGKSRLLREVHQALHDDREVAYLDLGTTGPLTRRDLVEAIGQALEVGLNIDDPLGSLVQEFGPQPSLLILDEAERSMEPVAEVAGELLARCPSLRLLVASRRPLGIVGETTVPLEPLPVPAEDADLSEVAASDAVRLLNERITDLAPAENIGSEDLMLLGRLARRVDGLPLALELLAGYAGTHALPELEDVLKEPIELTSVDAGRPERHRTLRDTILWSVDRLPPGHRQVLRRLGVFSGSFDLAAARAVVGPDCDDVENTTRALVREGLVQARREGPGLVLRLPTAVRELAAAGLDEKNELADAQARHRRWHAAERWRGELRSEAMLLDMRYRYPDYLAALRSGLEDRDRATVGPIAMTLSRYWGFIEMIAVGARWLEEVLTSGLLSPLDEARLRTMRAHLVVHHDPVGTQRDLSAALPVLEAENDTASLVTAHIISALERFESGDLEAATASGERAVAAASQATQERQADAYGILALVQASTDAEAARVSAKEAWSRASGSGNPASRASVATNVSLALMEIGDATQALTLLRRAAGEMNPEAVPTFLVFNTSWAELLCGDPASAWLGFTGSLWAYGEALGDRFAAEAFAGAACALSDLDRPEAAELLAGATELLLRNEQVLQPWQTSRLERARARTAPWAAIAWPDGSVELGRHLATLTRQADLAMGTNR
ncbi:BTAD domain-containing putative transcriptional regulator [Nocardioides sp.]|uniref:BTAD domain-containing putative transcriptional regulator n=1 Tax=Nocardioides sp. TaxID=35761 RepID=UPI003782EC5B